MRSVLLCCVCIVMLYLSVFYGQIDGPNTVSVLVSFC